MGPGRPRKIRSEHLGDGNLLEEKSISTEEAIKKKSKFLPFVGSDNLIVGEPRFFVNGKKLIRVLKKPHGTDKQGNIHYCVERRLFTMIFDDTRGNKLRSILKKAGIPGLM